MFESARLKIKWADKHFSDFNDLVNTFVKTDFYSFGIDRKGQSSQYLLNFRMTKDPPCELPLILGDSIHNLWSALDHAYIELLELIGKQPRKWSSFKIYQNRKALISQLSQGILQGEPEIVGIFADRIRAYEGGDSLLKALYGLDVSDKHTLLIPIFGITQLNHVHAKAIIGGTTINMKNCTLGVDQGGTVNVVSVRTDGGEIKFEGKGEPTFCIFFGNGTGLEGQPIIPTFSQISQTVNGIITAFEDIVVVKSAPR